ncbi:MAG: hypothetical protein QNJ85_18040 [Gammaproteobacteria bacterium]|nr:hypothetical protein [Gammaproteobacteria bacterium]
MKLRVSKYFVVTFLTLSMASCAVTSIAQDEGDQDEPSGPNRVFLQELQDLVNRFVKDANKGKKTATKETALETCATALADIGFQLSSLLVAPLTSGGGADARSWEPGTYDEVCTNVMVNGQDVIMCIRVEN